MPLLRSTTSTLSRPSIHDLSTFLLSPQTYSSRCHSSLARHPQINPPRKYTALAPHARRFSHTSSVSSAPKSHDRGPISSEDTQTDFGSLNVLGGTPAPSTSIDACLWDGFHLNSGVKIVGGSGVLLVAGEAFGWRPWEAGLGDDRGERKGGIEGSGGKGAYGLGTGAGAVKYGEGKWLLNEKGQWEVGDDAWGLLGLVWPKPDLLILGLGKEMRPLSPKTRQFVNSLGIRIDIQDTRNAAAQFNLLATERGVGSVAAALVPLGWREGVGVRSGK